MEPMLLSPAGKDYLWGGRRLKWEYGKCIDVDPLAETWECSVHTDGLSVVRSGKYAGWYLKNVLKENPEYLGRRVSGELPILVKLIDADQDLSVQVHPDDEFAGTYENDNGKTELWYILDAKPGAKLVYGFSHDVTEEQLRHAIEEGTLSKHLQYVSVRKGDVFYIPPGTIHAIGAGILLAEIQETSNITYRVYDYARYDRYGRQRPLHFDKAVRVLNMKEESTVKQRPKLTRYYPGCSRVILGRCRHFEVERIQLSRDFSFSVSENPFQILLCVDGKGTLESLNQHGNLCFRKGDCVFLPANLGRCHVLGEATLLKIRY